MSHEEPVSYTFLIRIWAEEIPEEVGRLSWRGHITQLPHEDRCYVQTLEEITRFMQSHVAWLDMADRATTTTASETKRAGSEHTAGRDP